MFVPEWELHGVIIAAPLNLYDLRQTVEDPYCRWDAESDKYVVEYKSRTQFFPETTLIEKDKFDACMAVEGKQFLYVVFDGMNKVHIFNVSELVEKDYDFQWHTRECNKTTQFGPITRKDKYVGLLNWKDAKVALKSRV